MERWLTMVATTACLHQTSRFAASRDLSGTTRLADTHQWRLFFCLFHVYSPTTPAAHRT